MAQPTSLFRISVSIFSYKWKLNERNFISFGHQPPVIFTMRGNFFKLRNTELRCPTTAKQTFRDHHHRRWRRFRRWHISVMKLKREINGKQNQIRNVSYRLVSLCGQQFNRNARERMRTWMPNDNSEKMCQILLLADDDDDVDDEPCVELNTIRFECSKSCSLSKRKWARERQREETARNARKGKRDDWLRWVVKRERPLESGKDFEICTPTRYKNIIIQISHNSI